MVAKKLIQFIALSLAVLFSAQCARKYDLTMATRYVNMHIEVAPEVQKGADNLILLLDNADTSAIKMDYFCPIPEYPANVSPNLDTFLKFPVETSSILIWVISPTLPAGSWWNFGIANTQWEQQITPSVLYWEKNLGKTTAPVAMIPLAWEVWEVRADTLVATMLNPIIPAVQQNPALGLKAARDLRGDLEIERSWAFSKKGMPIYELMWSGENLAALQWNKMEGDPVTLKGNEKSELKITGYNPEDYSSVIVKYSVKRPGATDPIIYVIDQVEIEKKEK